MFGIDDAALAIGASSLVTGAASFFGGQAQNSQIAANNAAQLQLSREQFDFQKEMAHNGIAWRTQDAINAGIHPVFALGGSMNFSPVTYNPDSPVNTMGSMHSMGQDLSRAFMSTRGKGEREISEAELTLASAMAGQRVQRGELENELLKAQIASINARLGAPQIGPTNIAPQLGASETKPVEILASQPDNPGTAAGQPQPVVQYHKVGEGLQAFPAKGVTGLDDLDLTNPVGMDWVTRYRGDPNMPGKGYDPPSLKMMQQAFGPAVTGVEWSWRKQLWVPIYGGSTHYTPKTASDAWTNW